MSEEGNAQTNATLAHLDHFLLPVRAGWLHDIEPLHEPVDCLSGLTEILMKLMKLNFVDSMSRARTESERHFLNIQRQRKNPRHKMFPVAKSQARNIHERRSSRQRDLLFLSGETLATRTRDYRQLAETLHF